MVSLPNIDFSRILHTLPWDAWKLIQRLAHHPPRHLLIGVVGFYVLYALITRLRTGRWLDAILLSLLVTAAWIFAAACFYILATRAGYRLG